MPYPTNTNTNTEHQFTTLITHILKQSNWKLKRQGCTSCQFKNTTNGKIYEVFQWRKNADGRFVFLGEMDDIGQSYLWGNDEIYMDVLCSTEGYYMREKAVGTLADKVRMNRIRGCTSFSQEELLNTFTPILESMLRNPIPSFYPMSPQNIVLDSNYNIKLINPLLAHPHQTPTHQHSELNTHKKLAIIILETALLLTHQSAYNLVRNFDKFVIAMIGRGYSQRIIGLVLILLNQGLLPVCVKDWMSGQCTNSWFVQLKKYLTKIKQTTKHPTTTLNAKIPKNSTNPIYPNNDQTQDSQNQTISKYRSGKRIKINNPEIEDEEEENQATRRRRYRNRNGFNY